MENEFIVLKTGRNELTKFAVNEILYFKAEGNYTRIKMKSGVTFIISKNLKNTLVDFKSDLFVKINRSVVVNWHFVTLLKTGKAPMIEINHHEVFRPSQKYIAHLKHIFVHTPKGSFHTMKGGRFIHLP